MIDEGNGHDEGDLPLAIVFNDLGQLLSGIRGELFFEIPRNVLQAIVMLRWGCLEEQGLHKELLIRLIECSDRHASPLGHQPSHAAIVSGAVGEYQQLVLGVELHQDAATTLTYYKLPPPFHGKDALDEIITKRRIMEPSLILKRQQGEVVY